MTNSKQDVNKKDLNEIDKKIVISNQAAMIYFVIIVIAQLVFSNMWAGEIKKIDLMQLVIAPACCFSLATMAGWYKNTITTFFSNIWICALGVFFYLTFQKFTFLSGSSYENLLFTNFNIMGKTIIGAVAISTIILTLVRMFSKK